MQKVIAESLQRVSLIECRRKSIDVSHVALFTVDMWL